MWIIRIGQAIERIIIVQTCVDVEIIRIQKRISGNSRTAKRFPPTNSNRVILGRLISSTHICFFWPYYYRNRRGFPLAFPSKMRESAYWPCNIIIRDFVSSIAAFVFVSSCTFYVPCLTESFISIDMFGTWLYDICIIYR